MRDTDKNVIKYKSDRVRYTVTEATDEEGARADLLKKYPNAEFLQFLTSEEYHDWKENGNYHRFGYQSNLYRKFFVFYDGKCVGELVSNNGNKAYMEAMKMFDVPDRRRLLAADFQRLKYMKEEGKALLQAVKDKK